MINELRPIRAGNDRARHSRHEYLQVETAIRRKPGLENQLVTWLGQNRRLDWIKWKLEADHGITITPTHLSAFALRQGITRDALRDLLPWKIVLRKHERMYPYLMLLAETRLRAGTREAEETLNRLILWKQKLADADEVVDYQPDTCEVWWYVPRRPGIDLDLVRVPGV